MKRIVAMLTVLVLLMTLCSCGTGGTSVEVDPSVEGYFHIPVTGEYGDGILLPELNDAHVTVMMSIDWSYLESNNNPEDPFAQYHATLLWREAYAAQQGDVEIVTISEEQMTDYLATQTASGSAPDIIPANNMTYPQWNASGLTQSIEKYAGHLELNAKNPYNPEEDLYNLSLMENHYQWGGESHGAVTLAEPDRVFTLYNKTKFEQAGQATPMDLWKKGEWNWTNFIKTAKAMTTDTDYGFTGWGLFPYNAPYPMAKLDEEGKVSLAIDDTRYMRYMTEVYNAYQTDKIARCDWALQEWATLFPAGTDAMVFSTKARFQQIVNKARRMEGDEFGIAPVPVFDPAGETQAIADADLWAYSISSAAKNPIGAATYIRLETLVSRNVQSKLAGTTWYDNNLTDDEKAMMEQIKNDPVSIDIIIGIGNCYLGIVDANIVPAMYYVATQESVQAIFDAQRNALQAEFDEFNQMVEETAAELAAKQEAAAE